MSEKEFYSQTTLPGHQISVDSKEKLPESIGPYRIESLLDIGGMSVLYLGKQTDTNQLVVIKVLSPKFVSNEAMKEQFLKEAEIIALTDHPNIVKLYGQGEWEGGLYIAMEFIQGISLRQFIVQHSLSLRRSLDIVLQVSYALLHLHTHGVIHRDLKPENIIITENGQVKVIDFGIAQLKHQAMMESKAKGGMIGTPSYMSPELRKDPSSVSYPTDIYSLGVIAYELIIGKLSFGNINLNLLPKHLRAIIKQTLSHDLDYRYLDIVDFITDISQYLKNNTFQKERSEKDELKELLEVLSQSQRILLPQTMPNWDDVEIGLAKPTGADMLGVCYDFVKLYDRSKIFVIAETTAKNLDSTIYVAFLKGMIRMSLHEHMTTTKDFDPMVFITLLNEKLAMDHIPATFRFNLLHLKPTVNEFLFVSSGFFSLWHQSKNSAKPKLMTNENPLLGESMQSTFYEIKDSWYEGEQIYLHTFNDQEFEPDLRDLIEKQAETTILENATLSSQNACENILKKMILLTPNQVEKNQKIVLSIQRID